MAKEIDELAARCAAAQAKLARAGRTLHDDIGPQLAGSGFLLSILRGDHPKAASAIQDILSALDKAMESVRALSQELNASPVDRLGLRHALQRFCEHDPRVELAYSATATLPRETASALYEMAAAVLAAAQGAKSERIRIAVTGSSGIRIRITDDGRTAGRKRVLAVPQKLAEASGIAVTITTRKSTIVSITHAVRRSAGRRP